MTRDKTSDYKAFLPIGITFLAVAVVFLATGANAGLWIAFFSIGMTFLILSQTGKGDKKKKSADPEA